jgi:hypothetical protein
MPEPVPTPTAAQIVDLSDILSLSITATSEAVAADESQEISNAKWAKTLADLTTYATLYGDAGDIKRVGTIEFFENKAQVQLLRIINGIRRRYGVTELDSLTASVNAETTFAPLEICL